MKNWLGRLVAILALLTTSACVEPSENERSFEDKLAACLRGEESGDVKCVAPILICSEFDEIYSTGVGQCVDFECTEIDSSECEFDDCYDESSNELDADCIADRDGDDELLPDDDSEIAITIRFTETPTSITNVADAKFEIECETGLSCEFACSLDDGPFSGCADFGRITLKGLQQGEHSLAVKARANVFEHSSGGFAPLALGTGSTSYEWTVDTLSGTWKYVSANSNSCGIDNENKLYCWGVNFSGALGNGTSSGSKIVPTAIRPDLSWQHVANAAGHSCGVTEAGGLYCWGSDSDDKLGNGSNGSTNTPERIGVDTNWSQVWTEFDGTCALKTTGQLYCWGDRGSGLVDGGFTSNYSTPQLRAGGSNWVTVDTGSSHGCGINNLSELYCWGWDGSGALGIGAVNDQYEKTPLKVGVATDWNSLGIGSSHTCATNTNQELYCWGNNSDSQIGDDTTTQRNTPTRIAPNLNWQAVFGGRNSTCAITDDYDLYCWGSNSGGNLGVGDTDDRSTPTLVSDEHNWIQGSFDSLSTCFRTDENKLDCWGTSYNGNGSYEDKLAPDLP